jgi:hypothetical protein
MACQTYSDEQLLQACHMLVNRGIDPTYRAAREAGFVSCGTRFRMIRDAAVAEGTLVLPLRSKLRCRVVANMLEYRRTVNDHEDRPALVWRIPQTAAQFLEIERRNRCALYSEARQAMTSPEGIVAGSKRDHCQWVFWFCGRKFKSRKQHKSRSKKGVKV